MINLCRLPSTIVAGIGANAYDGDLGTYYGWQVNEPPGGTQTITISGSWTFDKSYKVEMCGWKVYIGAGSTAGATYNGWSYSCYFYITSNGGASYIYNASQSGVGNSSGQYGSATYYTDSTGWTNVTNAVVYSYGLAQRGCGGAEGGGEWAFAYYYEIEVWANPDGNTIFFGCNT